MKKNVSISLALFFILFFLNGCATSMKKAPADGILPSPELTAPPNRDRDYQDSRTLASHSLTTQGYALLEKGDADGAIRLLQRAVGLNPSDGPGYFFLAEAWFMKENYALAARFNRLAELYLRREPEWAARARDQKAKIASKL